MSRPQILSVSLSPITRDARVLRQVEVLARHGEVTTVGYGELPSHASHHLRVEDGLDSLPRTPLGVAKLAARRLESAELDAPGIRRAMAGLRLPLFWILPVLGGAACVLTWRKLTP